eukprot:1140729-Pelagomonas_calceolata.AAC.1
MARLVEVTLSAYAQDGHGAFVQAMGSIDSLTHTQEDLVENDLGTLKLFAVQTLHSSLCCCYAAFSWAPGLVSSQSLVLGQTVCATYIRHWQPERGGSYPYDGILHIMVYKATGSFGAYCMFLVVKGACA